MKRPPAAAGCDMDRKAPPPLQASKGFLAWGHGGPLRMTEIVECVPNVSEGRRKEVIDALSTVISQVAGVKLLDVDPDESHNRTVFTFVGAGAAVSEAAFQLAKKAAELIDLNHHQGEHPRMGATDVVPFVPVQGARMEDCVALARKLGERLGVELRIPVFLYGEAASRPDRRNLPDVRRGEFEGLRDEVGKNPDKDPDYGPRKVHPTAGATAVGARPFLIAYNVNLASKDIEAAKEIAAKVRERDGGLPAVRALGFELADRGLVQVSMNLVDFAKTSPEKAFEAVSREAKARKLKVHSSEVVGLVPLAALPASAEEALQLSGFSTEQVLEVKVFGRDDPDVAKRLARVLGKRAPARQPAVQQPLGGFLSALASGEPTPGGGAASALLGAVGASLVIMVCKLSGPKAASDGDRARLKEVEALALGLSRTFEDAVDEDSLAYDAVVEALRRPKETAEEKAARSEALQKAFRWATEVPLAVAEAAAAGLGMAGEVARTGLQSAASDAGVAGKACQAALEGAALNVLTNVPSIKDEAFVKDARARLEAARSKAAKAGAELEKHLAAALT